MTFALPKLYQASSTLFVGENRQISVGAGAVQLDDQLARTYADLLVNTTTQRQVATALRSVSPDELGGNVSVEVVPGTRLIRISALDADPRRAQSIANTYAQVFVDEQEAQLSAASRGRLDRLNRRIGQLALELSRLNAQGAGGANAARRAQIENELASQRQAFSAIQESGVQQGSNVSVSSLAVAPEAPAKPRRKLYLALAVILALILGAAAALVRNLFDRRVRDEEELTKLIGAPILARVPVQRGDRDQRAMSEAFDFLRVNLHLSAADSPARTIAVTSSLPGDGKSTVSARLARAFAQQGADVIAADCDLRKPALGRYLGVHGGPGVTNVLVRGTSAVDILAETDVRGVRLLPSGPVPPNPAVLLGLPRFAGVIGDLRAVADYVVVDTPPVPAGVDTSAISQVVDGVVLVIDLNRSDRNALEVTRDQLEKANSRVLGIVLNRVSDRLTQYGYGTDYSSTPAEGSSTPAPPATRSEAPPPARAR